jgi:F-type H+-transporting ATPase subunit b
MGALIAEIFAFVLVVFLIYRYVWPPLKRMMEQRQDAVQKQVEESEEAARRLAEAERRLEATVAEAREVTARIRDDARADAARIREELREQAEREAERIKQRGEEQLVAQRDQVVRRLRAEISALSFETAQRMIVEALSDDERRRATVDRFLDELDGMSARSGDDGQRPAPAGAADRGAN